MFEQHLSVGFCAGNDKGQPNSVQQHCLAEQRAKHHSGGLQRQ